MDELLYQLEKRIKKLMQHHHELNHSNQNLQQKKVTLVREKDLLLARQEKAIHQIKSLVAKLKAVENLI